MSGRPTAAQRGAIGLFAAVFISTGIAHFAVPRGYDAIMPRVIPEEAHRPLTYLSGAAELVVGALMLRPSTRALGGRLTVLLLLAVWPANIQAALDGSSGIPGLPETPTAGWIRVAMQIPLIAVAWWISRLGSGEPTTSPTSGPST